jgi:hypothetical protein
MGFEVALDACDLAIAGGTRRKAVERRTIAACSVIMARATAVPQESQERCQSSGYLGNPFVYDRARDTAILIEQGIFEYLEVWEWPAQ